MRTFTSIEDLRQAAGDELGVGDWVQIDQQRVDQFAEATGDHQWIHVDVDRAASGPFGGTIAHGYLTLSLVPWLGESVFAIETPGAKLNYGVNKVRFPQPLLVGSRIRLRVVLADISDVPSGTQVVLRHTIEIEDAPKPACVAETVVLLLPDA
ncbi:MaoC family dehydratase [Nocardioides massiliensis]|uniref:Acyl dehydratase n=1 Tax=Nocardioides massiliensis TaxID=1325935 RepID=A0ABT9NP80_9ACTN|nr:MaoC family dehydratase [Nocardioides massiliensis]MDP9822218.1 acyl dehydratase [Nocardioides massiliensis]